MAGELRLPEASCRWKWIRTDLHGSARSSHVDGLGGRRDAGRRVECQAGLIRGQRSAYLADGEVGRIRWAGLDGEDGSYGLRWRDSPPAPRRPIP